MVALIIRDQPEGVIQKRLSGPSRGLTQMIEANEDSPAPFKLGRSQRGR